MVALASGISAKAFGQGRTAMNATQYRAALKRFGITQKEAARFLKIDERTSRRYALGEPIPHWVEPMLLTYSNGSEPVRKGRPVRKK